MKNNVNCESIRLIEGEKAQMLDDALSVSLLELSAGGGVDLLTRHDRATKNRALFTSDISEKTNEKIWSLVP